MIERAVRMLGVACALVILGWGATAQDLSQLRVGQWVRIKGRLDETGTFQVQELEVRDPDDQETLIGTVTEAAADRLVVLGQPISISPRTKLEGVVPAELLGARVEVEGYYRGPGKFSAREIKLREKGRDRLEGRIDEIRQLEGRVEISIMRFKLTVQDDVVPEVDGAIDSYALAPQRTQPRAIRERSDDDQVPASFRLRDDLYLGVRTEYRSTSEQDYNLDSKDEEDRTDYDFQLRAELTWIPSQRFYAFASGSSTFRWRHDDKDPDEYTDRFRLREGFAYVRDVARPGLDLQIGRQDFFELREWLYDENLDGVRLLYTQPTWRAELSASTILFDGTEVEEDTNYYTLYVSNRDEDRHLAAYVIDKREEQSDDKPFFYGVRALGEWVPQNEIWAELAFVDGYEGDRDLEGWGFDVGTTWKPDFAKPFYFNAGYAFGSGDGDASGDDQNFRQTGLQDNNDKLGGVTSYRYYGELVDPELSNLHILTLGVGARFAKRQSLDLVWHAYEQDEAANFLRDTDIDRRPNGDDKDLGWELDLVYGNRSWKDWDLEIVGGIFEPGDAFGDSDDMAWIAKFQLRHRF